MYGDKDFIHRHHFTDYSSTQILKLVFNDFPNIKSVIDVGCGVGTWLHTAKELGAEQIMGIEGQWLDIEKFAKVSPEQIKRSDLNQPIPIQSQFDLLISLEVAEHLTPERAEHFIEELCSLAPLILFSGAVPGQRDKTHQNEQWPSYWAEKFSNHGFKAYDAIRWRIWNDTNIPYWYRQNPIVYAHESLELPKHIQQTETQSPAAVVHPDFMAVREDISFGQTLKMMGHTLKKSAVKRMTRVRH